MSAPTPCPHCAAPLPAQGPCLRCLLQAPLPPLELPGGLTLGEELGRGGMGTVHRAHDARLGRDVAVKLLPDSLRDDGEACARLEREARVLARLAHPHVVGVLGFHGGDAEVPPHLVMELVEGGSLAGRLPLPGADVVRLGIELASALAHAHAAGVIHRDVKPANVLLDREGRARLSDFGISRLGAAQDAGWTLTAAGQAPGTPGYLAPEVLRGEAPSAATDLYALGVLLYQASTGQLPGAIWAPLPGGLSAVLRRVLSPEPRDRYPSAERLREALESLRVEERSAELPEDELQFMRACALLCTGAAASGLWAGLASLTPRVVLESELPPLTHLYGEPLGDGRMVSRARFEVAPMLFAIGASALAFLALGLLRRHWRLAGLDSPRPMRPLEESRTVLRLGLFVIALYAVRLGWETTGRPLPLGAIQPVFGGLFEVFTLLTFFTGMLQAWRTARPLAREPMLFVGLGLAVVAPVGEFLRHLARWHP